MQNQLFHKCAECGKEFQAGDSIFFKDFIRMSLEGILYRSINEPICKVCSELAKDGKDKGDSLPSLFSDNKGL